MKNTFITLFNRDLNRLYKEIETYTDAVLYFLVHLNGHLNYHLGQINYHRRLLTPQ